MPATKVYQALATAQGVAGWWTRDATGSSKVGGKINVRFRHKDGNDRADGLRDDQARAQSGSPVAFPGGPPEWVGTDATFELTQDGDMTVLLFGHRNWKEPVEFTAHCSMKWAVFLLSLREFVETGKGRPSPDDLKIDNWN